MDEGDAPAAATSMAEITATYAYTGSFISAGTSVYPGPGQPSVALRGGIPAFGGEYFYQCFYRNAAAAFCPPATSNRTNGMRITWSP